MCSCPFMQQCRRPVRRRTLSGPTPAKMLFPKPKKPWPGRLFSIILLLSGTRLALDASNSAIGAELSQYSADHEWRPIAFYSKSLTPAEKKYSAFDRELLAIYLSIKHFRHFLEGRSFHVLSDHKPLTFALESSTVCSPWQTRHLSFIAEFTSDIRHIKGNDNVVADTFSRPEISALQMPSVDFASMAAAQDDQEAADTSLDIKRVPWNGLSMLCDLSLIHI